LFVLSRFAFFVWFVHPENSENDSNDSAQRTRTPHTAHRTLHITHPAVIWYFMRVITREISQAGKRAFC
jgi:hypothetical protein